VGGDVEPSMPSSLGQGGTHRKIGKCEINLNKDASGGK